MNGSRDFFHLAATLSVGKRVGGAVYVHRQVAEMSLPISSEMKKISALQLPTWNCLKVGGSEKTVTFLEYLNFEEDPHPILRRSLTYHVDSGRSRLTEYNVDHNPPILHRKELLVGPEHSRYVDWTESTAREESLGLYDATKAIGFLRNWQKLLQEKVGGHRTSDGETAVVVDRHKTAISRSSASKPVQALLSTGMLTPQKTFFDYGCGKGDDLDFLGAAGFRVSGWDPVYRPNEPRQPADVVNLGFVLNVIEDEAERIEVLRNAFQLSRSILCVSTLIENQQTAVVLKPYKDGFITSRNTFQKYFRQAELAQLLEDVLEHPTAALGPGIFFVFRKHDEAEAFFLNHNRRPTNWTAWGIRSSWSVEQRTELKRDKFFAEHEAIIELYWNTTMKLGRFPVPDEFPDLGTLLNVAGAPKRLQAWTVEHFGADAFERANSRKREDVIVYLALRHFQKRLPLKKLPTAMQRDIQATFPSFDLAWATAKNHLFQIGKPAVISELCDKSSVGRLDAQALFVTPDEVDLLDPVLRIYVETGELFFGDRFQAHEIKIHKTSGKVTFLVYLEPVNEKRTWLRTKVNLSSQKVEFYDHTLVPNQHH